MLSPVDAEEEEEAGCLGGREPLGGGCGTAADIGVSSSSSPVTNWGAGVRGAKDGSEGVNQGGERRYRKKWR